MLAIKIKISIFARIFDIYIKTDMSNLIKPEGYKALLDMKQTEQGIKLIKDFFQQNLATELHLHRVTAPLFVLKGLGINDDLKRCGASRYIPNKGFRGCEGRGGALSCQVEKAHFG
jgi:hypothetical protein